MISGLDYENGFTEADAEGVEDARATVPSPYGQISFAWKKGKGGVACELEVPFGTQAQVWLPAEREQELTVNGQLKADARMVGDGILDVGTFPSGRYTILLKKA